ncbi:MAG: SDR family oxidoreductase [Planctomycetota bacterium]
MSNHIRDKVVIVTGASSGIGEATAVALGDLGAKVVCAARRTDRIEAIAARISEQAGEAIAVECDVTDRGHVDQLIATTIERFGGVDALVNNAGVMPLSPIEQCRVETWDQMVDVNIKGVLYATAAVTPHFLERGAGHFINISSVAGRIVLPGASVYCGTKWFVHAFSDGLRAEMADKGIRVSIVAPGYVATELLSHIADPGMKQMFDDMGRSMEVLQPEDIASAVVYALEQPPHVSANEILVRPTKQQL